MINGVSTYFTYQPVLHVESYKLSLECDNLPSENVIVNRFSLHTYNSQVRSKLKVQNSSTFQGPKLHFSSTKIIDKKPYPRRGHSKFRLQCDTEASKVK